MGHYLTLMTPMATLTPNITTLQHTPILWPDASRADAFEAWLSHLAATHRLCVASVRPASADASFRRYFRIDDEQANTRIIMDAPPQHEHCGPFVNIATLLHKGGLYVPQVLSWDAPQGFMLLTDLGEHTYLSQLNDQNATALYLDAIDALVKLQAIAAQAQVSPYDRALLLREMQLFEQWYVKAYRGATLTPVQSEQLAQCFELLLQNNLAQPCVLVHRDYHSRNLMHCQAPQHPSNPGLLDFQDAVWGPITYDLISLLRDAYVDLEEDVQLDFAVRYWQKARQAKRAVNEDFGLFWRDLEWMGLQRHLKVLGIFARLSVRDGKHAYLNDLPRVWRHAHRVATRYNGLGPLALLLEQLAGTTRVEGFC
jgi:N-acetylmuramate 1-kinase